MVSIIHKPTATSTPMAASLNKGSCHDLVKYLSKEEGGWEKSGGFFTNGEDNIGAQEAQRLIDTNVQGLHKSDDKFYMLTLNPSQQELQSLIYDVTGRPGIKDMDTLTPNQQHAVFDALKDYTRACMDRYAWNFNRVGVEIADDLVYFAKIETERHYQGTDKEVKEGRARSGDVKPGLQLHVHVCVSRRSRDGIMLNPFARANAKRLRRDPQGFGSFYRRGWDYQNAQTYQTMFGYVDQLNYHEGRGRAYGSFANFNPDEEKEKWYWFMQMERRAKRLYRLSDVAGHSDLLEAPKKMVRMSRFLLAFIHNPTHAIFRKAATLLVRGAIQQMSGL